MQWVMGEGGVVKQSVFSTQHSALRWLLRRVFKELWSLGEGEASVPACDWRRRPSGWRPVFCFEGLGRGKNNTGCPSGDGPCTGPRRDLCGGNAGFRGWAYILLNDETSGAGYRHTFRTMVTWNWRGLAA